MVGPSKQASIHTHVRSAVTLVWGSLRLIPIRTESLDVSNMRLNVESVTGPAGIAAVAYFESYAVIYMLERFT